jgi:hypothetical protein
MLYISFPKCVIKLVLFWLPRLSQNSNTYPITFTLANPDSMHPTFALFKHIHLCLDIQRRCQPKLCSGIKWNKFVRPTKETILLQGQTNTEINHFSVFWGIASIYEVTLEMEVVHRCWLLYLFTFLLSTIFQSLFLHRSCYNLEFKSLCTAFTSLSSLGVNHKMGILVWDSMQCY